MLNEVKAGFFFFLVQPNWTLGSCKESALPAVFHTERCSSVNQVHDTLSKVYTEMVSQKGPMEKEC